MWERSHTYGGKIQELDVRADTDNLSRLNGQAKVNINIIL
jgi:hypothetical protein